jgi:hypothetical protein
MKEAEYNRLTFDLTMHFAETVSSQNTDMVFCYVSGAGTDSTEAGHSMWARVKGKTENHLMILPFKKVYAFRPGYLHPTKGLVRTNKLYAGFSFLYPILKRFFPKYACTLQELGQAMINVTKFGYHKNILDPPDIVALAHRGV